jgi:hypothetical protein
MRKALGLALLMLLPLPGLAQVQTTIAPPSLNVPTTDQAGSGDADATYCRPPQRRTDSMLMGPRVCMTYKQWADLHAGGFDIGPDGSKVRLQRNTDMLTH